MRKNTYHFFFSNLANSLKMNILAALKEKPMSVSELVDYLKVEQSKISHALSSLRCCNIVKVSQKGKERIYSLNKETILPMLRLLDKHEKKYCRCCEARKKK